jgi:hypothetical protein
LEDVFGGQVDHREVAGDDFPCVFGCDVPTGPTDHDREFGLGGHAIADVGRWETDRPAGTREARSWLEEGRRFFRATLVEVGGVVGVVEPDPEQSAGVERHCKRQVLR